MNEYRDSGRPDNTPEYGDDYTDYPPTHCCEDCGTTLLTSDDAQPGEGVKKCPDCECWYCGSGCLTASGLCKQCAVDAEALRLEAEIEKSKASHLRTMG